MSECWPQNHHILHQLVPRRIPRLEKHLYFSPKIFGQYLKLKRKVIYTIKIALFKPVSFSTMYPKGNNYSFLDGSLLFTCLESESIRAMFRIYLDVQTLIEYMGKGWLTILLSRDRRYKGHIDLFGRLLLVVNMCVLMVWHQKLKSNAHCKT